MGPMRTLAPASLRTPAGRLVSSARSCAPAGLRTVVGAAKARTGLARTVPSALGEHAQAHAVELRHVLCERCKLLCFLGGFFDSVGTRADEPG
jgi:limonene-1,2-epoxide hydrolase